MIPVENRQLKTQMKLILKILDAWDEIFK